MKDNGLHREKSMVKTMTIKYNLLDDSSIDLLARLEESGAIIVEKYSLNGSIVVSFLCKTKKALQVLRSILESGDLQKCLTIIFTMLSDSCEELEVNIKAYTTDLKWAEDYVHEKGSPLITFCIIGIQLILYAYIIFLPKI